MKWKHRCFHSKFGWKRNAQASSSISSDIQECRYTQRRRIGNPGSSLVVRYGEREKYKNLILSYNTVLFNFHTQRRAIPAQ